MGWIDREVEPEPNARVVFVVFLRRDLSGSQSLSPLLDCRLEGFGRDLKIMGGYPHFLGGKNV